MFDNRLFFDQPAKINYHRSLWQAVIDDQRPRVIRILNKYPNLLLLPAPDSMFINCLYSSELKINITGETVLSFSAKNTQIEMLKIFKPFLAKLAQQSQQNHILIQTDLAKWPSYVFVNGQFALPERYRELIEMVSSRLLKHSPLGNASTIKAFENKAWPAFRDKLLPEEPVTLGDGIDTGSWNMDLLLLTARVIYEARIAKFVDEEIRGVYLIRVLGFLQRLVSPETAKVLCADLEKVVYEGYKVSDRVAHLKPGQQSYSEQEMALKMGDSMNFYPARSSDTTGQGYEWFCDRGLMTVGAYSASGIASATWTQFMLQKQTEYEGLLHELTQEKNVDFSDEDEFSIYDWAHR
ncbi:MAG: hypothetical protein P4L79_11675 [Legionella sp.]|uniref:hypothetical protein n=1 Tax=Legionella sp. TaxID=459 RepID=UPI0028448CE4|nr:hypothetical protein [Legionella sp.]